jgi:WD40 repeat protein
MKNDDGDKVMIAVGTYDGVVAAWKTTIAPKDTRAGDKVNGIETTPDNNLEIIFASPIHEGSVRSLALANRSVLVSTGYDEVIKVHDFQKHVTSAGEIRTPSDFGTPTCSAFAPPIGAAVAGASSSTTTTHCLVGFGGKDDTPTQEKGGGTGGKLVIYKKRDWSIQHVLHGHEGGVCTIAVHPTGKLALTGGISDGKIKLWDLERGRLAYSSSTSSSQKIGNHSKQQQQQPPGQKRHHESIVSITWSKHGDYYGFCYGSHITVREVATGKDLLDVELPSRVNQICLLQKSHPDFSSSPLQTTQLVDPQSPTIFVAAACNDGSIPVLMVQSADSEERKAIMAIEPVDGPVAGEERFKCIQTINEYTVATANSAGVVSVMNLQGAVNILLSNDDTDSTEINDTTNSPQESSTSDPEEENDIDDDDEDSEEEELAVDIIASTQLGTGARITSLAAWICSENTPRPKQEEKSHENADSRTNKKMKRADGSSAKLQDLNSSALEKARALVSKAKKIQKKKNKNRTSAN